MNSRVARLLLLLVTGFVVVKSAAAQESASAPQPAVAPAQTEAQLPEQVCQVDTPNLKPLEQGRITVGCPKVWRSDRVFTVLDGLLRDVDSITVKALQGLDPNEANEALIESLVTDFQMKAKFDQAAQANNALKGQQIRAQRQADMDNFNAKQESNKALLARRKILADESLDLQKQESALIKA